MYRDELNTARDLIQQKRYDEARILLESINHLTATKWLAKLDMVESNMSMPLSTSKPQKGSVFSWRNTVSLILIVVLIVIVAMQQIRLNNLSELVGTLEINVSELVSVVNSHATDLNTLSSDLNRVAVIANNADNYAHSHTFSDADLKSDITKIDNPLERILSLRGVSFTWNTEAFPDLHLEAGRDFGLVAQELASIFPELVTPDTETNLLRVDYEGLIPILIEAIREQQQQIDELRLLLH